MQIKQSETLQRHLRVGSREAQRTGIVSLIVDAALLSAMKDGRSHAGQILLHLLKDWEIYQIGVRIERDAAKLPAGENNTEDQRKIMSDIMDGIERVCISSGVQTGGTANTGHFLLWALSNHELISSRVLELYGVTVDKATQWLKQLPENEDLYIDAETFENYINNELTQYEKDQERDDEYSEDEDNDYDEGGGQRTKVKRRKRKKSMIEQFAVNLTQSAREGEIDPVIGRGSEIERLVQILGRRKKNNPVLIGEPGVGKSAIVEGLALRMAGKDAPHYLRGKEVYSLDVASLVAGTKYRGEFEQRIKELLKELMSNRDIILFIDEIHTIVGAGSTQGSLDTANILKPVLARGELQCIGATTLNEYRENIESDGALERRFQKIIVEPTTKEQTLEILSQIKVNYEQHHCVRYSQEALRACVDLTDRYVTDRCFPDKAIDVLDEAGSKAKLATIPEPEALRKIKQSIEQSIYKSQKAMAEADYEGVAKGRLRTLTLRAKMEEFQTDWQRDMDENPFVIGEEHIEEIITIMTGIPVERVSQGEKARLGAMGEHLASHVVGQDTAVSKVVRSIQLSRTGLKDPNKPIGVFMFVGPSGVGKTHLTKELSKWMFDRDDALIRIDMSEYSEKHNVSRMIGSPPGYVGYNEGGQLTEAVRRQPYAVILFDEIEKAHPDVFNIMLQIFDDGQLTDGLGRRVDFRNTVIIMTSNVGSRTIANKASVIGYSTTNKASIVEANTSSYYRSALDSMFAPEFINRIDDIVVFNTLSEQDVERIVDLELGNLLRRAEKLGYKVKVSGKAKKRLANMGYESKYGVRSLKRTILDNVEEPLAQLIVSGELNSGDTVKIDCKNDGIELIRKSA